jgi:integrase
VIDAEGETACGRGCKSSQSGSGPSVNVVAGPERRRRESRRGKRRSWTVDDARWFLESTWHAGEALYGAFVLILILGLRKGEVLGLTWELNRPGRG